MKRLLLTAALAALAALAQAAPTPMLDEALSAAGIGLVNNINCGIPPIPPIGCQVGDCVCDQTGRNCRWTFRCN